MHHGKHTLFNGSTPAHERGTALIISLVIMLVLTLIGVTAMQTTTMEERMAGNMVDINRSFQAGEAALREGEGHLEPLTAEAPTCNTAPCDVWAADAITEGTLSVDPSKKDSSWWAANAQEYGPAEVDMGGLAADPLYVIEHNHFVPDSLTKGHGVPTGRTYYRVTARATGGQDSTISVLQSTYVKRYN